MLGGALTAWLIGVDAERKPLDPVATPLSSAALPEPDPEAGFIEITGKFTLRFTASRMQCSRVGDGVQLVDQSSRRKALV